MLDGEPWSRCTGLGESAEVWWPAQRYESKLSSDTQGKASRSRPPSGWGFWKVEGAHPFPTPSPGQKLPPLPTENRLSPPLCGEWPQFAKLSSLRLQRTASKKCPGHSFPGPRQLDDSPVLAPAWGPSLPPYTWATPARPHLDTNLWQVLLPELVPLTWLGGDD
jgi:hypothetical protein